VRAKNRPKFSRFLTTFDFHREYLRNGSTYRTSEKNLINRNPFHVGNLVNFSPQTKKFYRCILSHPSGHFSGDYISAIRGCCPLKFLYTLDIEQGYIAHTTAGTGVPSKIICKNLKFGQKSSVCAPITSRLVGVPSQNFSRPRGARGVIT